MTCENDRRQKGVCVCVRARVFRRGRGYRDREMKRFAFVSRDAVVNRFALDLRVVAHLRCDETRPVVTNTVADELGNTRDVTGRTNTMTCHWSCYGARPDARLDADCCCAHTNNCNRLQTALDVLMYTAVHWDLTSCSTYGAHWQSTRQRGNPLMPTHCTWFTHRTNSHTPYKHCSLVSCPLSIKQKGQ